ncbi:hypothetical protein OH687_11515 [Burkholderia anthina]|nr:hypothetical protein OH687_11515 [Burkholderia anthina]
MTVRRGRCGNRRAPLETVDAPVARPLSLHRQSAHCTGDPKRKTP